MRLKRSTIFWTFIWSIFMGITVGSIGIGAVFPAANRITAPFLCSGGQLQLVTQDYHPSPVELVTTLTWYCLDGKTGTRREVSLLTMSLIAGTIYGLLLFVVIMAVLWIRAGRGSQSQAATDMPDTSGSSAEISAPLSDLLRMTAKLRERPEMSTMLRPRSGSESVEQRLEKLKSLRDAGLITEQDYARTKARILNDL